MIEGAAAGAPRAGVTTPARQRLAVVTALAIVSVAALLVRVPAIAEPLGIDQSLWASAARGLSRGQMLYRDVWDQKPPGVFLTYLAGFSLFGWTPASVAWLDLLAAAATTGLLFAIVRRLGSPATGALAAALYAALTIPGWLYRHGGILERSVAETFIVVCAAFTAWCAIRLARGASPAVAAALGVSAGTAVMFKPNAAVYLPAFLVWMTVYADERRRLFRTALIAGLSAAIVPGLTLVWIGARGAVPDAWVALVAFNRFYVSEGWTLQGYAVEFSKAIWLRIKTDPLWCAGAIGAVIVVWDLLRSRSLHPLPALAVAWGCAAALAIVANGARLYNSYFIQAFAPLAVLAAWVLAAGAGRSPGRRVVALGTGALMLVLLLVRSNYPLRVYEVTRADIDQWRGRGERAAYLERFGGYGNARGYSARANEELAAYVRTRTDRDQSIFLFGINGAGVYFAADRLAAQRFLRVNFFVPSSFPDPAFQLPAVTQEIAAARPVYVIFERLHSPTALGHAVDTLEEDPNIARLLEAYAFEVQIEDFRLYRRLE